MKSDRGAALALIGAAILGLLLTNSPFGQTVLAIKNFEFGIPAINLFLPVQYWVKDLLLAVFFLVAGLELKHELRLGVLASPATALVPVLAALGGVIAPAMIYAALNWGTEAIAGWPIPTATDIAFALGVLAIFGRGLPKEARIFLLALAIFDDLIAIILIAIFFTESVLIQWLLVALVLLAILRWTETKSRFPQLQTRIVLFALIWYAVLQSGVHPTIAGVMIGLTIPARKTHSLMSRIQPITNGFILPLFAFSALAITLPEFQDEVSTVFTGIVVALPVGKILGISLMAIIANRIASKDARLNLEWIDFVALAALAGVGFTVSLLMAALAFKGSPELLAEATIAVVIGSLISMAIGAVISQARGRYYRRQKRQ